MSEQEKSDLEDAIEYFKKENPHLANLERCQSPHTSPTIKAYLAGIKRERARVAAGDKK